MCSRQLQAPDSPAPPLQTLPPLTCPALPVPPAEPVNIHCNTPVTGLFSPGFTYANDVALGLSQGFQLLLLVPHAACIGAETFKMYFIVASTSWSGVKDLTSMQSLKFWHTILMVFWLIIGVPVFISFPFQIYFKALSVSLANSCTKILFHSSQRTQQERPG